MEKIKKIKFSNNAESDFMLRILAIIIAVIIWVVLSITQYPTTTVQVSNVPVVFSMDGTNAENNGLSPTNYKNITVNVEIKGMKYEIGGYTDKDLTATVNMDQVTKEGAYLLDIDVKSIHSSDQCTIVSVSPSTIEVNFQKMSEKSFDIQAEAPYISAEKGLTLNNAEISPSNVTIKGSEKDVSQIDKITAKISESRTLSENTTITTSDLVFYDKNNKEISPDKFSVLNNKNFDVTFLLYRKKNMKLNVDFTDCPTGFNASSLPYKLSHDTVSVISPNIDDDSPAVLTIGSIAISDINLTKDFEFKINLADGDENLDTFDKVKVTFDSSNYSSKKFTLTSDNFKIINQPSGRKVTFDTQKLTGVTIFGPESVIDSLSDDDLVAEVDLKGVEKTGSIKKELTIYAPKYNNVWCYGKHNAQVVISNK